MLVHLGDKYATIVFFSGGGSDSIIFCVILWILDVLVAISILETEQ